MYVVKGFNEIVLKTVNFVNLFIVSIYRKSSLNIFPQVLRNYDLK